jgi:hypothetical protein
LIAQIAQQLQPIIEIEKAWLPPHPFAPKSIPPDGIRNAADRPGF